MGKNQNNYLEHYSVLGMKWGRRKQKPSSGSRTRRSKKSNIKKSVSSIKKKIKKKISKVDKEKVKDIAKTTAKVAGGITAASFLGSVGYMAYKDFTRLHETYYGDQNTISISSDINDVSKRDFNKTDDRISFEKTAKESMRGIINKDLRILRTTDENGYPNGMISTMATKAQQLSKKTGEDPSDIVNNWLIKYNNSDKRMSDIILEDEIKNRR